MDLRPFGLNQRQVARAAEVLGYQPFRISDTIVAGIAHSWVHETVLAEINHPQMIFDSTRDAPERWRNAVLENERLDRSYSAFLEVIAGACPGGSYLDICCNTGYFPVAASARGMTATGIDGGDYAAAFDFLNEILGGNARFVQSMYELDRHAFVPPVEGQFDIVSNMAFLIHVAEPLHLLRFIAERARHAVFLWSAFLRDDAMIVRYPKPNQFTPSAFPLGFDAGVAISDTLLIYSMGELGFPTVREIAPPADGWPPVCGNPLMAPYEPLRAFLFTRS